MHKNTHPLKISTIPFISLLLSSTVFAAIKPKPTIIVGSKTFSEGYIISEIFAQVIESQGEAEVVRKFGLNGTGIVFQALNNEEIDIYPEYTGTLRNAILSHIPPEKLQSRDAINKILAHDGLTVGPFLGFNNSYAVAIRKKIAEENYIHHISDLKKISGLKFAFDHEFLQRSDGTRLLSQHYGLEFNDLKIMRQNMIYEAIATLDVDVMNVYATDAKIDRYELQVLKDDLRVFPQYEAFAFYRLSSFASLPKTRKALNKLANQFSLPKVRQLNHQAEVERIPFHDIARNFPGKEVRGGANKSSSTISEKYSLWAMTERHFLLIFVSLFFSILVGMPLGIICAHSRRANQYLLVIIGILQTIPSLAFLCILIPLMGIGIKPALMTLFCYGLLPIVRNTCTGMMSIDRKLLEVPDIIGLNSWQKLVKIELPLAKPMIFSGIKTSAILNVGTATLAAFIGAGGYGDPIVTGLALNNHIYIMQGAIPAALMAITIHFTFEGLEKKFASHSFLQRHV